MTEMASLYVFWKFGFRLILNESMVSILSAGEMIVSPMKTLFMDEISTGLDSSTTFQIVKYLQQVAHIKQATIVMSLLQPAT